MKTNVLYMDDGTSVARGYIDALRHLKYKVYVCWPTSKLEMRRLIEKHNVRLIFTQSRYQQQHQLMFATLFDS